ncbi:hypothetical protein [Nisaea sp.]|uniref:hypothetical protein n=1 Tax=Nisaea sp. TaxID=2024842 RepID=UPI003B51CBF9
MHENPRDGCEAVRFRSHTRNPGSVALPGRLRAALEAWSAAPKAGGIALRRMIALESVEDAIGHIGIADVLPGGTFRYRLFGSALVAALGYDATGWRTDALTPPAYAEMVTRQYREVVAARRPLLHEIRSSREDVKEYRYVRLTAPLTLGDGGVDQLWMTVAMIGSFGKEVFMPEDRAFLTLRD